MKFLSSSCLAIAVSCFLSSSAWGSSAYVVDDADIAPKDTLQNENWISHNNKGETLEVVNGAYQIMPNTEFTLEFQHDVDSGAHSDTVSPQIKYLWRKGEDDTVGSSVVVGAIYLFDESRVSDVYAYVPASLAVTNKLDVNVNLGLLHQHQADENFATWGVGTEYHATDAFSLVGEVFGRDAESPGIQLGPRYAVGKSLVLDVIYGHNVFDESEEIITAGLTVNW